MKMFPQEWSNILITLVTKWLGLHVNRKMKDFQHLHNLARYEGIRCQAKLILFVGHHQSFGLLPYTYFGLYFTTHPHCNLIYRIDL